MSVNNKATRTSSQNSKLYICIIHIRIFSPEVPGQLVKYKQFPVMRCTSVFSLVLTMIEMLSAVHRSEVGGVEMDPDITKTRLNTYTDCSPHSSQEKLAQLDLSQR